MCLFGYGKYILVRRCRGGGAGRRREEKCYATAEEEKRTEKFAHLICKSLITLFDIHTGWFVHAQI